MGKLIKSKLRKIAIASSWFFDSALLNENGPSIEIVFPDPIKTKSPSQAFNSDTRKVAGDFRKVLAQRHVSQK